MEELLVQLERLAQAFPKDKVSIEATKGVYGAVSFIAWIKGDPYRRSHSRDHADWAVDSAIEEYQKLLDPRIANPIKIEELKSEITRLEAEICDHKFIDSNHCLKCGWKPAEQDHV